MADATDADSAGAQARGLMLGLLLGDSVDEWDDGVLHGTCLAQLACFTLEGMIRACVRSDHKGICDPASVVWHAWCRWAHLQGIGPSFKESWGFSDSPWPDGWLSQVSPLGQRRGDAPATVTALRSAPMASEARPTRSHGHHAVTRALPMAIFAPVLNDVDALVRNVTALTHDTDVAREAAVRGVQTAAALMTGRERIPSVSGHRATAQPADSALAVLHTGAEASVAASFQDAVRTARLSSRGAATVAGALWGARHGVQALPTDLINRLEIGWAADQLARDAIEEIRSHPSGGEYTQSADPTWWSRYPGW